MENKSLALQIDDSVLRQMVEIVVNEVDPQLIYLFGSYASGRAGENSDLDLLIVDRQQFGPGRSRRREMTKLWRALASFRIPKDILVYTQEEVAHWRNTQNHVIARALREGKLLYERA